MKRIFGIDDARPVKQGSDTVRVTVRDRDQGVVISVDGHPALLSWEQGRHIAKCIMEVLARQDCPVCKQPWATCPCELEEVG